MKNIRPSEACTMLNSIGFYTSGWKTYYDNECGCSSRAKSIGKGDPFKNIISYYVEGSGQSVDNIRLILNILNSEKSDTDIAHAVFFKTAKSLIGKLTPRPVPESLYQSITNGSNLTFLADGFLFEVSQKGWSMTMESGTVECYEVKLVIR